MTEGAGNRLVGRWAMALVIVVLTISIYSVTSNHRRDASSIPTIEPMGEYVPEEVRMLLNFVDNARARGGRSGGHEFAATGIRFVAAALGTVANSAGVNIDRELQVVRAIATRIDRDPRPRERTAQARIAFGMLASLLETVRQARFRGLELDVANVGRAAASLRSEARLIDQRDVVQEFFNRAASAIRVMNREMSSLHHSPAINTA